MDPYRNFLRPVDPLSPPPLINPVALPIWFEVAQSANPSHSLSVQWSTALRQLGDRCRAISIKPFIGVKHQNPQIRNYLAARRRLIVRFFNITKMLKNVPVRRRELERSVKITQSGFQITVSALLRIDDPTWVHGLTRFSPGYRFSPLKTKDHEFQVFLDPATRMFVYNDLLSASLRWHVGYTVNCPVRPDYTGVIPGHEEDFVLSLWKPIQNNIRPSGSNLIYHL